MRAREPTLGDRSRFMFSGGLSEFGNKDGCRASIMFFDLGGLGVVALARWLLRAGACWCVLARAPVRLTLE